MKILVIGHESHYEECTQKFVAHHHVMFASDHKHVQSNLAQADVVFDFTTGTTSPVQYYADWRGVVFLNTTEVTLTSLVSDSLSSGPRFFGFCGLPTFLNRDVLEVCLTREENLQYLKEVCTKLETKFVRVADQAGLVTPRIVCMIINEAYYTEEEGTATRADIDQAMKLGTNYPYGPFEWGQRIGLKNVCQVLEAVYRATGDERYQICPLLKREAGF